MRRTILALGIISLAIAASVQAATKESHYASGVIKARYSVGKKGQMNGDYTAYHPNGTVRMRGTYQNGERVGLWIHSDRDGYICGYEEFTTMTVVSATGELYAVVR
jgi:antitoxin component YwqK of YwqJK toxin-antitoxin module